jgi:anaerobic magnesium-protoporphyrin IX monomethyl ester cyclase
MKIVFIYPSWFDKQKGVMKYFTSRSARIPVLGLAYLASISENLGHEVSIIDASIDDLTIEEVVTAVKEFGADIVGISGATPYYNLVLDYTNELKKNLKSITIAVGGPHVTVLKEKALTDNIDFAFIGEAEKSWPDFLSEYSSGKNYSNVKGIYYKNENGEWISTGMGEVVMNLDSVPFPARHLLKNEKYIFYIPNGKPKITGTIFSQRGCPFKCIFCSTELTGTNIRKRIPYQVVEELKMMKADLGIEHVLFLDESFSINRKHVVEICDLIIKEKLGITFEIATRANLLDESLVEKMVAAGLVRMGIGLESTDPHVREIMKKKVPMESYETACYYAKKYGVQLKFGTIIGMPGDTIESIRNTFKFLRNRPEVQLVSVTIATPYPGTELYDMAKRGKYGLKLLEDDFSKFQRYGSVVMESDNLSSNELLRLQDNCYVSFYMLPDRWMAMWRVFGLIGVYMTLKRFKRSFIRFVTNKNGLFWF